MNATRPQGVPTDATLLYPDQTFPPGVGVQGKTITVITAQNAAANAKNDLFFQRAMADWNANKAQYEAYHLRVPPAPFPPPKIVDKIVYANQDGSIVDPPTGADGLHYAWVWEEYQQ